MGQALRRFRVSLANLLWFLYSFGMSRRWKRATRDVSGTQAAVLKHILSENADSEFGREHHFAGVNSVELYQRAVPLRSYEEFQPYIERIADGQPQVLTAQRVLQFGLTSGSTQASKLIPYTKALVSEFQEGIDPWVYYLFRRFPRILLGKTYWSVTPIGERKSHTTGGIAIGFDDEQQYFSPLTRWVLNSIMAVPSQLAQLSDMEVFRYVTLRLLLQERLLSRVSVWNPSFLTLLLDPLPEWFSQLTGDIRQGTLAVAAKIEPPLRDNILSHCNSNPRRAQELERLRAAWQGKAPTETDISGRTLYEAIWPEMRLISCWAHGNAALALPHLKAYFPHAAIQPKGLLATEAFISFPFSPPILHANKDDLSALSLLSQFFESKVVDICGEKLNEDLVRTTVASLLEKHALHAEFWMMAPEWPPEGRPFYTLFIQFDDDTAFDESQLGDIAQEIEEALQESYHYEYSRRLGQLDSCRLFVIAPQCDSYHTYLAVCTDLGQRLGDIKPAALHAYQGWSQRFTGSFV